MTNTIRVGFCGVGNMSGAILSSALHAGILAPSQIFAFNPSRDKLAAFQKQGVHVAASNVEVAEHCDLIFFGFKPQKFSEIGRELRGVIGKTCVVSMLAGVSVAKIREILGAQVPVIRVLPNTPILVGQGTTAIAREDDVPKEYFDFVERVFHASGTTAVVAEDEINRVLPLSSSSPAFFLRLICAMTDAAEKQGMGRAVAEELARATMHGVAHLISDSEKTPEELIAQVTSPGGTTLAALTAFDDYRFEDMIADAFSRCVTRADELGRDS